MIAIRIALTVSLVALAAATLAALLLSSTRQSLDARIGFAFEAVASPIERDDEKPAVRLAQHLEQQGSSASLAPEGQYWLYVDVDTRDRSPVLLEMRHIRALEATFTLVDASGERIGQELPWRHVKGGIVVDLPAQQSSRYRVLGKVDPQYAMVIKVFAWAPEDFESSVEGFNRMGGALAGACAVLAFTMGLLALRNRDAVAMLSGLTVLLMLRVAAFNSGWDLQWLGIELTPSLVMPMLKATLPSAALAQTALFLLLFKQDLVSLRLYKPTILFCAPFVALLIWSPFADHSDFLRVWWLVTAPGAAWLLFVLARVVSHSKDRSSLLYALALGVTLAGVIAEIAYYLGLWQTRVSASLLGVLIGSAINAAAVAERLYTDRARAMEAQKREIDALREKEDNFQSSPIPLFEFGADGRMKHQNIQFRLFAQRIFTRLSTVGEECHWNQFFGSIATYESLAAVGHLESVSLQLPPAPSGERSSLYLDLQWTNESGEVRGSVQDVTERELARQSMQRLVSYDQLTGLLNIHGLIGQYAELHSGGIRRQYSLALIDLSRFESVNELFGHEAGDGVLKCIARRIEGNCTQGELVARVGADMFAVVYPSHTLQQAACDAEDLARKCTAHPVAVENRALAVSLCLGVICPEPGLPIEQAIGACQRTLQRAKRKRSGSVTLATEGTATLGEYLSERRILGRIADRLPTENFFQVMQPIIDLRNPRGTYAAESLIRMRSDSGEIIAPAQFIAAAERNGMMTAIDRWMIRTTCEWLHENRDELHALEYLTVNVSGTSLNDIQFHADVRSMLADFPAESKKLCVEITESVAVNDIEATTRFTEQLRVQGVKVALDDFGAGYTSFGYLRTIPAEVLKVDGEIIKSVANDSSSIAILRAIRDIASDLGMRCVAEFVSDFETVRALRELDIDFGQGYALSRPVAPETIARARSGADLIGDESVLRYLDAQKGRAFTTSKLSLAG